MAERFRDRRDAGQQLAENLTRYQGRRDVVVLGLPRGGVPVAAEVASRLRAPLDVFLVRKLGVPAQPELAMGAIAQGGVTVLNRNFIQSMALSQGDVDRVTSAERQELQRRERLYRQNSPALDLGGKTVILVDDGLATGSTMEAAIVAIRQLGPARVIAAAPVGARESCARLRDVADEMICVKTPTAFSAVGLWYDDFSETLDEDVRSALASARGPSPQASGAVSAASDPVEVLRRHVTPRHTAPS